MKDLDANSVLHEDYLDNQPDEVPAHQLPELDVKNLALFEEDKMELILSDTEIMEPIEQLEREYSDVQSESESGEEADNTSNSSTSSRKRLSHAQNLPVNCLKIQECDLYDPVTMDPPSQTNKKIISLSKKKKKVKSKGVTKPRLTTTTSSPSPEGRSMSTSVLSTVANDKLICRKGNGVAPSNKIASFVRKFVTNLFL